MKQLIVNADDFGISEGINRGIIECHRKGIVSSTSLMANLESFPLAIKMGREEKNLGIGIHLNLTCGKPVLEPRKISTLVNKDGSFHPLPVVIRRLLLGRIAPKEVEQELAAQVEKVKQAGIQPTHLDTHHHIHFFPVLNRIVVRLAQDFGIRRIRGIPATLFKGLYLDPAMFFDLSSYTSLAKVFILSSLRHLSNGGELVSTRRLLGVGYIPAGKYQAAMAHFFNHLPEGTSELVCHPGYVDEELKMNDNWTGMREEELKAVTSPETRKLLQDRKIQIVRN